MSTKGTRRPRAASRVTIEDTAAQDLLDIYIAELSRTPMRSSVAQKDLARRMRNAKLSLADREAARDELIRANLRFAFSVAKKYQNRGLPLEDLVSEANAGLCRAADKYDPDVGVNFISYAVWWIRQAIFSAITTKGRSVRLPLNRAGDLTRISKAQAMLRESLDREPTLDEVARVTALDPEMVRSLMGLMAGERSLDEPLGTRGARDEGRTLGNIAAIASEDEATVTSGLEEESRRAALLRALEPLPPRDRKVLLLYYGLETGEPQTLDQIAQRFGVTRERIRQLRDRALAALRDNQAISRLRDEWAA